jgi:hypothetical protein
VKTARARVRWRQLATIALVTCAITPVFNVLTTDASPRQALQGLVDALLISLAVGGYLLFVRDGGLRPWFRRLEEYAKRTGLDLVVSGTLLQRLALPLGIQASRCGELELRGKGARVEAYALTGAPR